MAADQTWRKSSHSVNQGECVEVATRRPGAVAVGDFKDPHGPAMPLTLARWREFLAGVTAGRRQLC